MAGSQPQSKKDEGSDEMTLEQRQLRTLREQVKLPMACLQKKCSYKNCLVYSQLMLEKLLTDRERERIDSMSVERQLQQKLD